MAARMRAATSSSASSQVIGSNSPEPFGPTRRSGVVSRPSPWMRRVMRRTLRQIQPSVSGLAASPSGTASIFVIVSPSTVTDSEHPSGQSSGQAVVRVVTGEG